MKKILISLLAVVVVGAGAFAATRAYFTDTETSTGNTFEAGTIDIGVGDENVWTKNFKMEDMKPSQTDYINFTVRNLGTNPVNVLKELKNIVTADGDISEPECTEAHGVWTEPSGPCTGDYGPKNDIDSMILYDLIVEVYDKTDTKQWWQTLYDGEHEHIADVTQPMFMGMIPAGWYMKVRQSYHLDPKTENWAQGDLMTFDIVLTGEQLKGVATLENKGKPNAQSPDVVLMYGDGIVGTLTYKVKDSKFNYSFTGKVTKPGLYSLIHYVDPWPGDGNGLPVWPGTRPSLGKLGEGTADGTGAITFSGNEDLNSSFVNAKVWLVPSASYDAVGKKMVAFPEADILFDTGLIDYYDADL